MLTFAKEEFTETKIFIKNYMKKQEILKNFFTEKNVKAFSFQPVSSSIVNISLPFRDQADGPSSRM